MPWPESSGRAGRQPAAETDIDCSQDVQYQRSRSVGPVRKLANKRADTSNKQKQRWIFAKGRRRSLARSEGN